MTFHVGQKVECVDDASLNSLDEQEIVKGSIYIVRWVGMASGRTREFYGLKLQGVTRQDDQAFLAERFSPIVEKKTDISIFTEILDRENAKPRDKVRA